MNRGTESPVTRAARILLLIALTCLAAGSWLRSTVDAPLVVGVAALLAAPWLSLLTPGDDEPARRPWALALLGLLAVSFLL